MPVSSISNDFRSSANIALDDEVSLFRKLANAIVRGSRSIFIDETHGATKCNVSFNLTTGTSTRCEISDLLIISRSKNLPNLRATFWQAKKQRHPKWASLASPDKHIDFSGQFNQWDLLSRRPLISGVAPFFPPNDLLACFNSPSIGSFGIFYERKSTIEVMHSTAEFVSCGNPKAKHPTLVANAFLDKYRHASGEIMVRSNLEPFLEALFNHQIGALLLPSVASHLWLIAYAKAKAASSPQKPPADFFSFYEDPPRLDASPAGDGMSILFIDGEPPLG